MILREIITPQKRSITVDLPQELVGKRIELLVFEIGKEVNDIDRMQRISRIEQLTQISLTDLSGFTFDRNEANNYDD